MFTNCYNVNKKWKVSISRKCLIRFQYLTRNSYVEDSWQQRYEELYVLGISEVKMSILMLYLMFLSNFPIFIDYETTFWNIICSVKFSINSSYSHRARQCVLWRATFLRLGCFRCLVQIFIFDLVERDLVIANYSNSESNTYYNDKAITNICV